MEPTGSTPKRVVLHAAVERCSPVDASVAFRDFGEVIKSFGSFVVNSARYYRAYAFLGHGDTHLPGGHAGKPYERL